MWVPHVKKKYRDLTGQLLALAKAHVSGAELLRPRGITTRTLLVLGALLCTLALGDVAWAQSGEEFVDDPDNPHFWHGEMLWVIMTVFAGLTFGSLFRSGIAVAGAALAALGVGVVRGEFGGMLLLVVLLQAGGGAAIWFVIRR